MRTKVWLTYGGIVLLAIGALVVDIPNGPDLSWGDRLREIKVHLGLDLQGGTSLTYQADTSDIPADRQTESIAGARDVIERRVNAFGVSEPVVQTSQVGSNWRVIVELPGVENVQEAIDRIGETPLLEFKEEAAPPEPTAEEQTARDAAVADAKARAEDILANVQAPGADFAALAREFSEDPGSKDAGGDLDFFGRGVMVPEFEDAVFSAEVGAVIPHVVESPFGFHVIFVAEERTVPSATNAEPTVERRVSHILIRTPQNPALAGPTYENTGLSGKNLKRAQVEFDQTSTEPIVALEFDGEGATLFEQLTERNVGKTIAIYLDGAPISVPRVNQKISGGRAIITGSFTIDEAKLLSQRLNAGALPVPIELVSQQRIGPSLGKSSVEQSLVAGIIGILLVALFMMMYYRFDGLLATVALMIYALVTLAIFKLIPVTLTLAGIAGFVLSIGMAVDANVLIFERIREERRRGHGYARASEQGFRRAWRSIRDSNASSLITCVILAWLGTSLVKGFAITLAIGILVSMFTAITVTRTFVRLSYAHRGSDRRHD
ncbi:MAG: protein translocase subunit SecD [Candidatus Kerfeldbacteria bacterium]|nr:protein translocase subunit SecD [Candidatus Kerfeldbacteria bacterium]